MKVFIAEHFDGDSSFVLSVHSTKAGAWKVLHKHKLETWTQHRQDHGMIPFERWNIREHEVQTP